MEQQRTYIADLTTEELEHIIRKTVADALRVTPRWVAGVEGLMEIFSCSRSTANRIKASGAIDQAIHQQGRTYMTDANLALRLFGERKARH